MSNIIKKVESFHNPNEGRDIINENFEYINTSLELSVSGHTLLDAGTNIGVSSLGLLHTISVLDNINLTGITASTINTTSLSASTFYSGGTDLSNIFAPISTAGDTTRVQSGTNIVTGGTANFPTINLDDNITLTTISATTLYSGSTDLSSLLADAAGTSADLWSAGAGVGAVIANNGSGNIASGNKAHAEGLRNIASGYASHAEGGRQLKGFYFGNTASGTASHAEGTSTTASGLASHSEGRETTAIASYSHTEGFRSIASGTNSHAEGADTTALGIASHSEGINTTAIGDYSHVGGYKNVVLGNRSAVVGGQNITGVTNDTVYVPALNLDTALTTANTEGNILVRAADGSVQAREASTISTDVSGKADLTGDTFTGTVSFGGGDINNASLVINQGGLISGTSIPGAFEFDGPSLYFTDSTNIRHNILLGTSGVTATTLNSLTDVNVSSIDRNTFYFDGTTGFWKDTDIVKIDNTQNTATIKNLSATTISGGTIYSGGTDISDLFLPSNTVIASTISGATDTLFSGVSNSDYLVYDGISDKWVNKKENVVVFSPTGNSQTVFVNALPSEALDATKVMMYIDGIKQFYSTDFTITNNTLTWVNTTVDLNTTDNIELIYL